MDNNEYKNRVKALFREGKATPEEWDEMATILCASKYDECTGLISARVFGPSTVCEVCTVTFYPSQGPCPYHSHEHVP